MTVIGNLPTGGVGGNVPGDLAFAIRAVRPNPVHGAMSVELALPSPGTVRVEIFDGAGRRASEARAFDLPAGPQTVSLGEGRVRAPGVYVLRASFAGRRIERRFVVLR